MKFNLSKNKYSGGYLANTILVLSAFTQSSIAHNAYLSVQEAVNLFSQKDWRIKANTKIVEAKDNSWIKDEVTYGDSIRKVIGEAIGKCITDTGEYAGAQQDSVITFNVTPKQVNYTAENWNAVVLWNYLNALKWCVINDTPFENEAGFDSICERLYNHYSEYNVDDLRNKLNKAISDIKAYSKELDLESEMSNFVNTTKAIKELNPKDFDKLTDDYQKSVTGSSIKITPLISLTRTYSKPGIGFSYISGNAPANNERLKIALNGTVYELRMITFWYELDEQGKGKFSYEIQILNKYLQKSTGAKEHINRFFGTFANGIQEELNRLFED